MKRILIILLLCLIFLPSITLAQTKTPTQKVPTSDEIEKISDKVDELKDKVASRVAQLKLVEKRGIVGVVESVSDIQDNLNALQGALKRAQDAASDEIQDEAAEADALDEASSAMWALGYGLGIYKLPAEPGSKIGESDLSLSLIDKLFSDENLVSSSTSIILVLPFKSSSVI